MHRRRRFFPDGDQEQRPQQVRTTSSGGPPIFQRPPQRENETGPRSGPSAPARRSSAPAARNGSGTETGPACISGSMTPAAARPADLPRSAGSRSHARRPPKALRTETAAQGPRQQPPAGTTAAGPQQVRTGTQDRQRLHHRDPAEISGTPGRPPAFRTPPRT